MTIDLMPTLTRLAGAELPRERKIDGRDIWPLLSGAPGAKSPHEALYFYWGDALEAVRSGNWKLHFPHVYRSLTGKPGSGGKPAGYTEERIDLALYDLSTDPVERTNVAEKHPEVVRRLSALADGGREDLGDTATGRKGSGVRPPGRLPAAPPGT
jgi:arylsulfatase A-like enzyme